MKRKTKSNEKRKKIKTGGIDDSRFLEGLITGSSLDGAILMCGILKAYYSVTAVPGRRLSASKPLAFDQQVSFLDRNDQIGKARLEELHLVSERTVKHINDQDHPRLEVTGIEDGPTSISFKVIAWAQGPADDKRNTEEVLNAFLSTFILTAGFPKIAKLKAIYTRPRCCQVCKAKKDKGTFIDLICKHIADGSAKDAQRLLPDLWLCGDCANTPLDKLAPELIGNMCTRCLKEVLLQKRSDDSSVEVPICEKSSATLAEVDNIRK